MASKKADHLFSLHLLLEWLSGVSGTSQYQEELSKIVRVVVAGKIFIHCMSCVVFILLVILYVYLFISVAHYLHKLIFLRGL